MEVFVLVPRIARSSSCRVVEIAYFAAVIIGDPFKAKEVDFDG